MSQALLINPTAMEAGLQAAFMARSKTSEAQTAAFSRFAKHGFPNRRVEGWKWSDFHAALRAAPPANDSAVEITITPSDFAGLSPIEFQIVNGRIILPGNESVEGLEFGIVDPAAASPHMDDHAIAALNVALTRKALGFKAVAGARVERPVLIRHINTGATPVFIQILARAEENASITIFETFEGDGAFTSTFFHLGVRENARVERYLLHKAGEQTITHGFCGVMMGRDAQFKQTSLSTGGRLARHETHMLYPADDGAAEIDSAALLSGARHSDFTTLVHHQGVGCKTRQRHKGVARDRGRNVFQGKFLVDRNAQKTDAKMTANALLLSDMAEANR